jgi:hypothetical protein
MNKSGAAHFSEHRASISHKPYDPLLYRLLKRQKFNEAILGFSDSCTNSNQNVGGDEV